MAQLRTTADIIDAILDKGGEVTDGSSPYEAAVLRDLNSVHKTIIAGGNEFNTEVDEPWEWARSPEPIVLELQTAQTGTCAITLGTEAGTFASAPAISLEGWFFKIDTHEDWFKIAYHAAGNAAFELDSNFTGTTNASGTFKAVKLDYTLEAQKVIISARNNKLDFEETASTELTATLTAGVYTPAELMVEAKTQLDSAGASTYTTAYDSATGKYSLASDLAGGGNVFVLLPQSGSNFSTSAFRTLGFDIEDVATAAAHVSAYRRNGISRLIEPVTVYQRADKEHLINHVPSLTFMKDHPITSLREGIPTHFSTISTTPEGQMTVRFNKYVRDAARIELPYIGMPIDLKDNAQSVPLIPENYRELLVWGGLFYLLIQKHDSQAEGYSKLAALKLKTMMGHNRIKEVRTGRYFGGPIARRDQLPNRRRMILRYGEPS